jgi:hypothetical protein
MVGLFSGCRREETVNIRFSDIQVDENNTPVIIDCNNLKLLNMGMKVPKVVVSITDDFRELIFDMGWKKH